MPRLMVSPRVKTGLMIYALVPLGLALAGAGLSELEELFAARTAKLAALEEQIRLREKALDMTGMCLTPKQPGDVLDAELVDTCNPADAANYAGPEATCAVHGEPELQTAGLFRSR